MTIIAWDGTRLAADKMATSSGVPLTCTKIHRVHGHLVGLAGDGDACRALLEWARQGYVPSTYPQLAKDEGPDMLVISPEGTAAVFGKGPYPLELQDKFVAIGCGRDFALAAMYLGRCAATAVEVACALDIHCGCGIDVLTLGGDQ